MSRVVPVNADGRHAIDELVAWHRQHYENYKTSNSLKIIDDKILITELQGRGYNLDIPQENKKTPEFVKIG